jgi:Carbohydrate-selective porin, OprB family/S-layer homology domain
MVNQSVWGCVGIFYFGVLSASALAQTPGVTPAPGLTVKPMAQVTSVNQLLDVQPTDWAFQAVQSLAERYGCIEGYPNRQFLGSRSLSRFEFAAGLNTCMEQIQDLIQTSTDQLARSQDLQTLQRLRQDFTVELASLNGRVDRIDETTPQLEANQFSTTTKLNGQAIIALNAGAGTRDRIIAPRGALITNNSPNPTLIYRTSLDLNTSFSGKDLLKVRLVTGSDGANDNAAGLLEPNLGSTLDFSIPGRDGQLSLGRLYYTLTPVKDLKMTIGPQLVAPDFVDKNRYANVSFVDFSTQALVNNFILLPRPAGAGVVLDWHPKQGPLKLRALYVAGDPNSRLPENQRFVGGGNPEDILLFPRSGGGADGGFFGDPYQGFLELEYAPHKRVTLRLQSVGGRIFGASFTGFGINFDLALNRKVGVFGRYGYASYVDTSLGDIHPQYWMAGLAVKDSFKSADQAGIAVGQPFIEGVVGDATQTNFEVFYNFPVNDRIRVTPLVQVIVAPGNQNANGSIVTGTLRTVFLF